MQKKVIEALATFFFLGKSPKAPGTMGTLGAIPVWYLLCFLQPIGYMIATFFLVLVSFWICERHERELGTHDSSEIVLDEVVGFLICMTWLPMSWKSVVFGFVVFRVLDILKPFPISYLDKKVSGGVGVVLDDVAAGLVGSVFLQILYQNFPILF